MTAILEDILTAVKTQIEGLDLADIADASIRILKEPTTRNFAAADFPAVLIAPKTPKHNPSQGTNLRDQIEYQISVVLVDSDEDQVANRNKYLTWYEAIVKSFRTPRLTGVASVVNSYVAPGAVVDPSWFEAGEYHAGITLWFVSWEART
ncbi:hypothetical protein [Gimesia sp.]|uniref:hypothetical protein n=1 Tax=Gimesia sp. TaxID=2024833 RepID=UPI000C6108BE|nr:hypothetical protein [Gimesia sp.]MAX35702.1 hypothetical protein [Gimesia sp.]|tara:strand:- start:8638 stop:9087 length:450 start_codon:yes stop_codon:yes gene_type:complete